MSGKNRMDVFFYLNECGAVDGGRRTTDGGRQTTDGRRQTTDDRRRTTDGGRHRLTTNDFDKFLQIFKKHN